jgi:hypothetical protein
MPADNGRFGVMAAVTPQKRQCKFETLYPAASLVEAATTPSRWDVSGKARTKKGAGKFRSFCLQRVALTESGNKWK